MIKVEGLTRRFGPKTAVEAVSFEVGKGEVLGFLGPNGAGKTTTMRMITGYIEPSEGKVSVCGVDMLSEPLRAKSMLGYLPENSPAYKDMTPAAFLKFASSVRGITGKRAREAIDRVVETCHIGSVMYQSIETLSKGYLKRVCLAQTIIHDPPVLILDEPTDGLDPNQKFDVRGMIAGMSAEKTIIISTHILEEVEACCTRALIIANGKLVADGTPAALKARAGNAGTVIVGFRKPDIESAKALLAGMPAVKRVEALPESPYAASFRLFPADGVGAAKLASEAGAAVDAGNLAVAELRIDTGRLDEVFRQITQTGTEV